MTFQWMPNFTVSLSHLGQEELSRMKRIQISDPVDPMTLFMNQQTYNWKHFGHEVNAQFPKPVAESDPKYPALLTSAGNPYGSKSTRNF